MLVWTRIDSGIVVFIPSACNIVFLHELVKIPVYLDLSHPDPNKALHLLVDRLGDIYRPYNASRFILDFTTSESRDNFLRAHQAIQVGSVLQILFELHQHSHSQTISRHIVFAEIDCNLTRTEFIEF